jgi:hypothetical protein
MRSPNSLDAVGVIIAHHNGIADLAEVIEAVPLVDRRYGWRRSHASRILAKAARRDGANILADALIQSSNDSFFRPRTLLAGRSAGSSSSTHRPRCNIGDLQ